MRLDLLVSKIKPLLGSKGGERFYACPKIDSVPKGYKNAMSTNRQLHQIGIAVSDMDAAVNFYGDLLGLQLIHRFTAGVRLAFFDLGGPRLMVEESNETNSQSLFYLYFDNLEQKVHELKTAGVEIVEDVRRVYQDDSGLFGEAGQSEYLAFIHDPSGNKVGLMYRK